MAGWRFFRLGLMTIKCWWKCGEMEPSLRSRIFALCRFVKLIGKHGWPEKA